VRVEVEKAKSFNPKLSEFIIATTGPKDAKIEEFARKITEEHIRDGLFSVHIWGWDDIVNRLSEFPELIEKHHPQFGFNTRGVKNEDIDEIKAITQQSLKNTEDIKSSRSVPTINIDKVYVLTSTDTSITALALEYKAGLDYSRDLINNLNPKQALEYLEKSKDRIWSNADSLVKFRLLTNIGSAKLAINQEKEAAKLFIEALQYNPGDEKALCNASLGYLLIGQLEKCKELANNVLGKNPASSRAYSLLVQASENENLKEIIEKVPEPYRTSSEIAYAIGHIARKRGDLVEAEKWFQIGIENGSEKEGLNELKGALGGVLLQQLSEKDKVFYGSQLDDSAKEQVKQSIQLLTEAWDIVSNTDLRNFRSSLIVNRSIAKSLLGNLEGAIKDIDTALDIEPSNPIFIKHRAILAYQSKDNQKAIELFEKILDSDETPEAPLLLADSLIKKGRFNNAKDIIEKFLQKDIQNSLKEEANRMLANLYADCKDFTNANKISDSLRSSNPTSVLNLVISARVARLAGRSDDAVSLLKEAERYITGSSTFREILAVATGFY